MRCNRGWEDRKGVYGGIFNFSEAPGQLQHLFGEGRYHKLGATSRKRILCWFPIRYLSITGMNIVRTIDRINEQNF